MLTRRQVVRLVALLRKVAGEIWDIGDPPATPADVPVQKNRLANLLDNAADRLERRLD